MPKYRTIKYRPNNIARNLLKHDQFFRRFEAIFYLVDIPGCDILGYLLVEYPQYWTSEPLATGRRPVIIVVLPWHWVPPPA